MTKKKFQIKLEIKNGDVVILYAHCSEINVTQGQYIAQGQEIAKVGATGRATGPHLHFQIEYNGESVDPLSFKYNNGMGGGAGGIGSESDPASCRFCGISVNPRGIL